jgi:acyl-CoA thioester hydrolase
VVSGPAGRDAAAAAEIYPVEALVEVRFRDLDPMGHVNNAVYLTYLEVARAHYWRALGQTESTSIRTYVLARVEIDYRSPVRLGDEILCGVRVEGFGRRSFTMRYRLRERTSGRVIATALTVQARFDYEAGTTRAIEDELKRQVRVFEKRDIPDRAGGGPA